jgi:hypothetical protein
MRLDAYKASTLNIHKFENIPPPHPINQSTTQPDSSTKSRQPMLWFHSPQERTSSVRSIGILNKQYTSFHPVAANEMSSRYTRTGQWQLNPPASYSDRGMWHVNKRTGHLVLC